jgi:ERCC4-related helicase
LYLQTLEEMVMELCENEKKEGYSISDDLRKFPTKARAIWYYLGAWALRHFLAKNYQDVARHVAKHEDSSSVRSPNSRYEALMTLLNRVLEGPVVQFQAPGSISNKVEQLLSFLKEKSNPGFSGVIFVRERVTAYVLSALLNAHSLTRNVFRCAPCVSSSAHSESWAKNDALPFENNENVVLQFRSGKKNLIIATSVLEEGMISQRAILSFPSMSQQNYFFHPAPGSSTTEGF